MEHKPLTIGNQKGMELQHLSHYLPSILAEGYIIQLVGDRLRIWNADKKYEVVNGWNGMDGTFIGEVTTFKTTVGWFKEPVPFIRWFFDTIRTLKSLNTKRL